MDFNHKIVTVKFLFLGVRMSSIIQTRVFWREFQYERETWRIVLQTYQEWQFHCFSYLKVFGKESYKISWSSKDVEYSFDNLRRRRMLKPENSNEEVKAIDSKSFRNVRNELILVQIQKISSGLKVKNSDFKNSNNNKWKRSTSSTITRRDWLLLDSQPKRWWRIISRTMISGRNPKDQNEWQMSLDFEKLWIMNRYEQSEECQIHCEAEEQDSSFPRFNSFQIEPLNLY
jgi:hypothetical protein